MSISNSQTSNGICHTHIYTKADLRGARGIKPPTSLRSMNTPLSSPLFLDETVKGKRGGRRREKEEEKRSGHMLVV